MNVAILQKEYKRKNCCIWVENESHKHASWVQFPISPPPQKKSSKHRYFIDTENTSLVFPLIQIKQREYLHLKKIFIKANLN